MWVQPKFFSLKPIRATCFIIKPEEACVQGVWCAEKNCSGSFFFLQQKPFFCSLFFWQSE